VIQAADKTDGRFDTFFLIRGATGVAVAVAFAIVGLYARQGYVEMLTRGEQRATLLASALDSYTTRVIAQAEVAMREAVYVKRVTNSAPNAVAGFYDIQKQRMPFIKAVYIVGEGLKEQGGADPGVLPYLLAWNAQVTSGNLIAPAADNLMVGGVILMAGNNGAFLPLRLVMPASKNFSERVVLGAIGADFLAGLHADADYTPDVLSVVVGADGRIIARWPLLPGAVGRDVNMAPLYAPALKRNNDGISYGPSVADGVQRTMANRRLDNWPILVFAGFERATMVDEWRARLARDLAIAASLLVFIFVLARIAWLRAASELDAERRLRDSEDEYRTALATLTQGVVTQAADGRIIAWNPSALAILGLSADQLNGRTSFDPRWRAVDEHGNSLPGEQHPAIRAIATGLAQRNVVMGIDVAEERRRWIEVNSVPLVNDGRVTRVVTSFEDITTNRARANELNVLNTELEARVLQRTEALEASRAGMQQLLQSLEQRALAQQRLIYILSHDLREPLNGITNFIQILTTTEAPNFTGASARHFEFISQSAKRMRALLDDLLRFVRLEDGELARREIDFDELMRDIESDLHTAIERTHARLRWQSGMKLMGDVSLIRILMQNLVSNAAKFVSSEREPIVDISTQELEDEWIIQVQDNGIGIALEDQARVFDLFKRLNQRSKYEGTGLGLAITRRVVELHGGSIGVSSTPGIGTCFTVVLPKNPDLSKRMF
jgi:PAS domain S-box-containing protein